MSGVMPWKRIVLAAVMSELAVFAVLSIVIGVYRFVLAPGKSSAEYGAFGVNAGFFVAPPAAGVATFCAALWACRRLGSGFAQTGALVGLVAVLFSIAFVFGAKPEDRLMYGVSYL